TDTLVLTDFKPKEDLFSNPDVMYQFKLVGPAEEAELLTAALRKKQLDPWGMDRLLKAVEKDDVLKLSAPDRAAQAGAILQLLGRAKGPRFAIQGPGDEPNDRYLSFGAEMLLRGAFARLLAHYRARGDNAAADALTREYAAFLKPVVERREKEFFSDAR